MADERMTDDPRFDGRTRSEHLYRYCKAAQWVRDGDVVVDAACGTGYARRVLPGARYVGVDRCAEARPDIVADLGDWRPDFDYDVWLSFETVEHMGDPARLVENAHRARRFCAFSVPVYPGAGDNPYHMRDYTADQLRALVAHPEWGTAYEESQLGRYFLLFQERILDAPHA